MKDLRGSIITRCEISGELYPVAQAQSTRATYLATSLVIVSPDIWHSRLGHPGAPLFSLLQSKNIIRRDKYFISPFALHVSYDSTTNFLFMILPIILRLILILFVLICGPLRFVVVWVINIISYYWMILCILCWLFLSNINLNVVTQFEH